MSFGIDFRDAKLSDYGRSNSVPKLTLCGTVANSSHLKVSLLTGPPSSRPGCRECSI